MSRTDHHSNRNHEGMSRVDDYGPYRIAGVLHRCASRAKLATLPEREAIAEQLADMHGGSRFLSADKRFTLPSQYEGLQSGGTYTIQSRGYAVPVHTVQRETNTRPNAPQRVRIEHVYTPGREVADCWREQMRGYSITDGPTR